MYKLKRKPIKFFLIITLLLGALYVLLVIKSYNIYDNHIDHVADKIEVEESKKLVKHVLCIVLTSEKSITTRGVAVYNTWGKHCDHILFACNCENVLKARNMTKENKNLPEDLAKFKDLDKLPILQLNFEEDYNRMGEKVLLILKLVYKNYLSNYRWFMMGDDDTYIFVDNLNKFSSRLDHTKAFMYGFKWIVNVPGGYLGGGSGILFGNEALKRLGSTIESQACVKHLDMYGDITIGRCSIEANVSIGNSNDELGRPRFNQQSPREHYYGPVPSPLTQAGSHNGKIGKECCSLETISFHYVPPDEMYAIYANKTYLKDLLT